MHKPIEFYYHLSPCDLYRIGNTTSPRMDHVRTCPPRIEDEESFEVKVYTGRDGTLWVDHNSGGLSLFDVPSDRPGVKWWKLTSNTAIPAGLLITKDESASIHDKRVHYSVRPVFDMPLKAYIGLLVILGTGAIALFEQKKNQVSA